MKKIKKGLSFVLVLIMILTILPMTRLKVNAMNLATFNEKVESFKITRYPNNSTYIDNPNGTGGYQCFGFANEIAKYIFGSYPTSYMGGYYVNSGWQISYGGSALDNLCVGDIVRYSFHSIFITGINGNTVYFCDANADGKNTVRYGCSISKSELRTKISNMLTHSGADTTGWVAHFQDGVSAVRGEMTTPTISLSRDYYHVGDMVNIYWAATSPDTDFYQYWLVIINTTTNRKYYSGDPDSFENPSKNYYSFCAEDAGTYKVDVYAVPYNDKDNREKVASKTFNVSDVSSETYADLGDDFYAVILNTACWKPITHVDDTCHIYLDKETNTVNQVWRFQRQSDGAYVISSCKDGKALEMYQGKTDSGNNISACGEFWGGNYQQWYLIPQGSGYIFLSKHFTDLNRVMDLRNGSISDGTAIQIYERNNTDAQIWSVYAGPEIQLKPTSIEVTGGTSSTATHFSWDRKYGVANYDLKIWKNNVDKNISPYLSKSHEGALCCNDDINLPAGTYEAYITVNNYYQSFESNYVKFTVIDDTAQKLPDGADPNDYEIVTEYRSRDKSTTTSASASLDGWTKYDAQVTGWTNWSAWQNNSVTASESREVKTQYINPTYKTVWHYSRDTGNGYSTYAIGYYGNPEYITLDYRLTAKGTIDGYTRYGSYGNYLADYWWNESSESVVDRAGYTQYSYRDAVYTHYFYKWSEWSEWSETMIVATDSKEVETRTVYRLKEAIDTNTPLIKIEAEKAVCGQRIKIPVIVKNTDLSTLEVNITYDSSKLKIVSVDEMPFNTHYANIKTPGKIHIIVADDVSFITDKIAVLTFDVIATDVCSTEISATVDEAYDSNDNFVNLTVFNKTIEIINVLSGDIDGNGKVNAADYAMLVNYVRCDIKMPSDEAFFSADINKDGTVDAFDAIMLDLYLNDVIDL